MHVDTDSLDRLGWLLVPDALPHDHVARLREAFVAPDDTGTQHVRLGPATPHLADWHTLADHPAILTAAAHVLGPQFHVRDTHGRNPRPGHGRQGLHTDAKPRADGHPFEVLTAIWPLDEFTAINGATRLVPTTHLAVRPIPRRYAQPLAHHPDELVITAPAGSLLLFNGHLWHSGSHNDSPGPRRAVQMVVLRGPAPV